MKKTLILTASIQAILLAGVHALPITAGNIVVERIGDGTAALSSTSTKVAVLEFTTVGGPVQTLDITGALSTFSESGTATSAGYLNLSTDGSLVTLPGYNAVSGISGVVGGTSAREFASITIGGTISSQTLSPSTAYQTNNFRSVISDGGGNFWGSGTASGAGGTGGIHFITASGVATQISSTVTNTRNVEIYNNQLYFSTGSGSTKGIYAVGSGLPTSGSVTSTLLFSDVGAGSPYGFFLADTNNDTFTDTAWVSDDRTGAGGGLQKWTFDGSAWTNAYKVLLDVSTAVNPGDQGDFTGGNKGLRGLTGYYDQNGAHLFATDSDGTRLVSILDSGATPTSFTLLANSGANYAFRGVDVLAVPEPTAFASLILGIVGLCGWQRFRRVARN